jgi:rifampicin phosphotransferase
VGPAAILRHVSRCWASLFTERAVTYRLRNGLDHRKADMAVVVQRMVVPRAAGILFTADPVTSNRRVVSVEAVAGLGEVLVSGVMNADVYKVRDGEVVDTAARGDQPVLTEAQAVRLAELGRRIEAHFGRPQDIEWCLAGDGFEIVQSRPITALFPIPEAGDAGKHVYVSVGHQQMMTDPMKPLGLSVFQLTALPRMYEAGGRLFVDVAERLASPTIRAGLIALIGKSEPLIGNALQTIVDRGDFIPSVPDDDDGRGGPPAGSVPAPIGNDPALVAELISRSEAAVAAVERDLAATSGPAVFDVILADIQALKRLLSDPLNHQVIMAGMEAAWWLNEHLEAWLGEKNVADVLTQSAPGNITSEMGLALLEVADVIRPHPEVVAVLEHVEGDDFLDELAGLAGGREARDAIQAYLDRYGMRCVGEIDITRPRWREHPSALVPALLGNIRHFDPGAGQRRFEQGRQEAWEKEQELLARLRALPGGKPKAEEAKRMIDRVRTFAGYREYPKYHIVSRYFVYRKALLEAAEHLVRAGVLREPEDSFYLSFQELQDVVRTHAVDDRVIAERRLAFRSYEALTPPRVLTSEGEVVAGAYARGDLPAGALIGLPVSRGTVEGRARVVADMAEAELEPDDILVTAYTDPSWTPLFVAIKGLVTEVGGLMTHGAVIAREYGLPAVVGVEHATRLIRDGQRIRVHGTDGYVELVT